MTDRHQRVFARKHNDLFGESEYDADFFNYSSGSYDPDEGEMTGQTRSSFATGVQVEIVPPGMDTTVDVDGTSFGWDLSIRVPESNTIVGSLVPLGEDAERPTEVEITDPEENSQDTYDPEENSQDTYELHGYTYEKGSGFIMCRLVEQ